MDDLADAPRTSRDDELAELLKELQRSQGRLDDYAAVINGWLFETDAEQRFVWMSASVEQITGVKPEWHYGKTRQEISSQSQDIPGWDAHLEALKRHEPFQDFVFPREGPDRTQWLSVSAKPFFDEDGNFAGYRGRGSDITRQIMAENEAEASRRLLARAIESLDQLFVLWDSNDQILVCNQKFRELNASFIKFCEPGTSFEQHIRAGLKVGAYPDAVGREKEWFAARLERHRKADEPMELERQDGRWILINEQRLPDNSVASVSTDITRLKSVEKLKDELVSTVSHELRTPLTAIIGALRLINSGKIGDLPAEIKKLTDISESNAQRLATLVNDLLDMNKLTSGKMEMNLAITDLTGVITQSLKVNKPYADSFGICLVFQPDTKTTTITTDEDRVLQLLSNLISNACKFSTKGSKVEITIIPMKQNIRVSVQDWGKGIPNSFHDKIFSRFTQADATDNRLTKGTGLGLNICQAIIEMLGGRIGFKSEPGKGSTFWFDLPVG